MNTTNLSIVSIRQEYVAPVSELFELNIERSILDVSRDGDNEHTEEEDLF